MSHEVFSNFGGVNQNAYSSGELERFAKDIALDSASFGDCMDSGRYLPALALSVEHAKDIGITAVPMFILDNGTGNLDPIQQTVEGYNLLKRQIEVSIRTAS